MQELISKSFSFQYKFKRCYLVLRNKNKQFLKIKLDIHKKLSLQYSLFDKAHYILYILSV